MLSVPLPCAFLPTSPVTVPREAYEITGLARLGLVKSGRELVRVEAIARKVILAIQGRAFAKLTEAVRMSKSVVLGLLLAFLNDEIGRAHV